MEAKIWREDVSALRARFLRLGPNYFFAVREKLKSVQERAEVLLQSPEVRLLHQWAALSFRRWQ